MQTTTPVAILTRVPPELREEAAALAQLHARSLSAETRMALSAWVKEHAHDLEETDRGGAPATATATPAPA
jgi:hypothetical protein